MTPRRVKSWSNAFIDFEETSHYRGHRLRKSRRRAKKAATKSFRVIEPAVIEESLTSDICNYYEPWDISPDIYDGCWDCLFCGDEPWDCLCVKPITRHDDMIGRMYDGVELALLDLEEEEQCPSEKRPFTTMGGILSEKLRWEAAQLKLPNNTAAKKLLSALEHAKRQSSKKACKDPHDERCPESYHGESSQMAT